MGAVRREDEEHDRAEGGKVHPLTELDYRKFRIGLKDFKLVDCFEVLLELVRCCSTDDAV